MSGLAGLLAVQVGAVHHRMPHRSGQWGIAIMVLGLAFVCYGTVPMVRLSRWRAQAFPARGRVVDHVSRPGSRGRLTSLPVIEFEADGMTVMFRSQVAGNQGTWPVGQAVDVLYDRSDPHQAGLADTGIALPWSLIAGIAVLGAFIAIVST
jgi:Protein of unknown function (DUF3592)